MLTLNKGISQPTNKQMFGILSPIAILSEKEETSGSGLDEDQGGGRGDHRR